MLKCDVVNPPFLLSTTPGLDSNRHKYTSEDLLERSLAAQIPRRTPLHRVGTVRHDALISNYHLINHAYRIEMRVRVPVPLASGIVELYQT